MQNGAPQPLLPFSEAELERYSRQLLVKGFGFSEQEQLGNATVAVSSSLPIAALYLACAGVGTIIVLEDSQEPRQSEYKVMRLVDQLRRSNPCVSSVPGQTACGAGNTPPADLTLCTTHELQGTPMFPAVVLETQPASLLYFSAGTLCRSLSLPSPSLATVELIGGSLAAALGIRLLLQFP